MKHRKAVVLLFAIFASPHSLKAEVVDTVRQLPCEQVCQPVFPSQIGRPVMWGIPARSWGSQEYDALAGRIEECRQIQLQAGQRAASNQCLGLADYVRKQFMQPRQDTERKERADQAVKELERQNKAVVEREEGVKRAEAEANDARVKADQLEKIERDRKQAIADQDAQAERRKVANAAAAQADADAKQQIERAKGIKLEAEAREQAARERLQAAEDTKAKALSDKVAGADSELRNFIIRNPAVIHQSQDQMKDVLLDLYPVKVAVEFCQKNSSVLGSGFLGSYSGQMREVDRRLKILEEIAIRMLEIPSSDIAKMKGPDGISLKNTRIFDELQANQGEAKQLCDEALAHFSRVFDFNQ